MQKKLTPDVLDRIMSIRNEEGLTSGQIQTRLNLSKGCVSKAFTLLGITKLQRRDNPVRSRRAAVLLTDSEPPMPRNHVAGTKLLGDAAEAVILAELMKAGKTVLLPFGDRERYDMVVHSGNKFLRIQCKAAWADPKRPHVVKFKIGYYTGRKTPERHTYTSNDVDGIAVWVQAFNKVLWVPVERIQGRTDHMTVNFDTTARGMWTVNSPEDFPFEVLLSL